MPVSSLTLPQSYWCAQGKGFQSHCIVIMFLDYIEIGASDFDTEVQKEDTRVGITVEPVLYYINRLPDKAGCKKINAAISDKSGVVDVYHIPDDTISAHGLPDWVRGCNSIGGYHPTVVKLLRDRGIQSSDAIVTNRVACIKLIDLVVANGIEGVYYLKVDTEGHDTTILKHYFENIISQSQLPHIVRFESNSLSSSDDVDEIIEICETLGYETVSRGHDTVMKINLNKLINKKDFSNSISNYYITGHPKGYDISNLPHDNTLEGAKKYCLEHGHSGVTHQFGSYEVRSGSHMEYHESNITSWVLT